MKPPTSSIFKRIFMLRMPENSQLYNLHEMQYAAIAPLNILANASQTFLRHPLSPLSYTGGYGRSMAAAAEVFERVTHRYGKPDFSITRTKVLGKEVAVKQTVVDTKPFCRLLHFKKDLKKTAAQAPDRRPDVGPSCHASARHRGSASSVPRRLYHRLARRPQRAHVRRRFPPRGLYFPIRSTSPGSSGPTCICSPSASLPCR